MIVFHVSGAIVVANGDNAFLVCDFVSLLHLLALVLVLSSFVVHTRWPESLCETTERKIVEERKATEKDGKKEKWHFKELQHATTFCHLGASTGL